MDIRMPVAGLLAAALVATGCGGGGSAGPAAALTPPPSTPAATSASPAAPASQAPSPSTPAPVATRPPASRSAAPVAPAKDQPPAPKRRCVTPPAASTGGSGRTVTREAPLDLLIIGDSMPEAAGPYLADMASRDGKAAPCVEIHYSTGLVRDDYFDWPAHAVKVMASRDPEAVVFMVGGNDGQNMVASGRVLQAGSAEWGAEYERRAAGMMRTFRGEGRAVYWIGMPSARSERLHRIYRVLNQALARAATSVPGVTYVDIWPMFTTKDGRYADRLPDDTGAVVLLRGKDGIHLSTKGALFLARTMLRRLNADWNLTA